MSHAPSPRELAAETARTSVRPHLATHWPGDPKRRIALVVLRREEIVEAQIKAVEYLVETKRLDAVKLALLQPEGLLEFEREVQLLSRAIRDAETPEHELYSAEDLRAELEPEVQRALIETYNTYERQRSPLSAAESPAALKEYLRGLKASGDLSTYVMCCGGDTLRSIALALADLWQTPTSESSSGT